MQIDQQAVNLLLTQDVVEQAAAMRCDALRLTNQDPIGLSDALADPF